MVSGMRKSESDLPDVSLPPVHRALRDVHLVARQLLEPTRAPRSIAGRIYRSTLNASLAMAAARVDVLQWPYLRRIRVLLAGVVELLGFLCMEGYLDHGSYEKLRGLIDR